MIASYSIQACGGTNQKKKKKKKGTFPTLQNSPGRLFPQLPGLQTSVSDLGQKKIILLSLEA